MTEAEQPEQLTPFEESLRQLVGPTSWDSIPAEDRKSIVSDFGSAISFPSPIPAGPDSKPIYTAIQPHDDSRPDSMGEAFGGVAIHSGVTARVIWEADKELNRYGWYRGLFNGVDQPLQQFVPGKGMIGYTPDAYFKDIMQRQDRLPYENELLDRWVLGEFDGVVDPTHLASLIGTFNAEDHLRDEAAKLTLGDNLMFGLGSSLLDPISMFAGMAGVRAILGPTTAAGLVAATGRNVVEGVGISAFQQASLAALGEDSRPEDVLSNFATGALLDAAIVPIYHGVFNGYGKITQADLDERSATAQRVAEAVKNDTPPPVVRDIMAQKAAAWAARQSSDEFKSKLDFENYRYLPSYKTKGGEIKIPTSTTELHDLDGKISREAQGFVVINNKTNRAERWMSLDDYSGILASEAKTRADRVAAAQAAQVAANRVPVTTGENDPINPNLTLDDFAAVPSKSLADKLIGRQVAWLSNYGLEFDPNNALSLVLTRTFERIKTIKGWANGKVGGFSSFETRMKIRSGREARVRQIVEKQVRDLLWKSATPAEQAAMKLGLSTEGLPASLLHKRQLLMDLADMQRLAGAAAMEDVRQNRPADPSYAAWKQRTDRITKELQDLGVSTEDFGSFAKASKEALAEVMQPYNLVGLDNTLDASRLKILNDYARIRLDPDRITFDGVINLLRTMRDTPNASVEALLKDAIEGKKRLEENDIAPSNRNSEQTLKRLTQYWNEDLGGYVHSKDILALTQQLPLARFNLMVTLDAYHKFVRFIETHAVYAHAFKEMAVADSRFRGRPDVQNMLKTLEQGTDRWFDAKKWEFGTPPYGTVKREIENLLNMLEDHSIKVGSEIKNNKGGVERVTRAFDFIRKTTKLVGQQVSDVERKWTDIAGNMTRSGLLTMGGISQAADNVGLIALTSMNGSQGSMRQMFKGMMLKWNSLENAPAMRNATFRNIALTGETNLSFATQRFSAADYELSAEHVADDLDALGRVRGATEALSSGVSTLSGTNFANLTNKGGALMSVLHDLIDHEYGIIPRLVDALDKMDAAKSSDVMKFAQAEDISPEMADYVLRTLNRNDLRNLAKKIRAGEYTDVNVKKRFAFDGESDDTIRMIANPNTPGEAAAIEKLAHTVNYIIDRRLAVPGMIESSNRAYGFAAEMLATFLRQPMAIATRILIGSSYRPALQRFTMLMTLLGGAMMVGFAKALLRGKEDEWLATAYQHPARLTLDALAWSGALGILGEKVTGYMLDTTSPDAFKRSNAGVFQTSVPLQGVLQTYARAFSGIANGIFNGTEMSESQVNAVWKGTIIGETTIARGIQRVWSVLRGQEDYTDAKQFLEDALDATIGVHEGKGKGTKGKSQ